MIRAMLAIAALVSPGAARAETPPRPPAAAEEPGVGLTFGLGVVGGLRSGGSDERLIGKEVTLDIGRRASNRSAVGIHTAVVSLEAFVSYDVAFAVQRQLADRVWLASAAGVTLTRTGAHGRAGGGLSFGLTAGYDLYVSGRGRIALYAGAASRNELDSSGVGSFTTLSLGVGFRYW
jgi:hypothetical protein